jgi:hypothetical protein
MSESNPLVRLCVTRRELATILAALRFHQDENLQGDLGIADKVVSDIATDGGTLEPMDYAEVDDLCQRLNLSSRAVGLIVEPPPEESGDEGLYRVIYAIDVHAATPGDAANRVHGIMTDPEAMGPIFQVMDHTGRVVNVDLSGP